ncbi:hypothetical protein NDU88_006178 [Pleurodeles waltl]|uniref:Uncharacterized protein n=1 Tax=Pleurodeles waltl TaxID=8319 RepID=A0AAV7QHB9_PLEWA|nr:hypothetical protein NDU88_006178 [Pleurodeles waltl]
MSPAPRLHCTSSAVTRGTSKQWAPHKAALSQDSSDDIRGLSLLLSLHMCHACVAPQQAPLPRSPGQYAARKVPLLGIQRDPSTGCGARVSPQEPRCHRCLLLSGSRDVPLPRCTSPTGARAARPSCSSSGSGRSGLAALASSSLYWTQGSDKGASKPTVLGKRDRAVGGRHH